MLYNKSSRKIPRVLLTWALATSLFFSTRVWSNNPTAIEKMSCQSVMVRIAKIWAFLKERNISESHMGRIYLKASVRLYEVELQPLVRKLLRKPTKDINDADLEDLRVINEQMEKNSNLAKHPDRKAIAAKLDAVTKFQEYVKDPWQSTQAEKKVVKAWKAFSNNAKRESALLIMKIEAGVVNGEVKQGFPNSIRFAKFSSNGSIYIMAFSKNAQGLNILALGTHENFYRDLNELR